MAKLLHKDPEARLRIRPAMNHAWFRDKLDANSYSEVEIRDNINWLEAESPSKPKGRKVPGTGSRSMNRSSKPAGSGSSGRAREHRPGPASKNPKRQPMADSFSSDVLKIDGGRL